MFARVKVEIGRCDVCGGKRAVYWSREAQAKKYTWSYIIIFKTRVLIRSQQHIFI